MSFSSVSSIYKNKQAAKEILSSNSFVPATALVVAADTLTGGSCFVWEIETIFEFMEDNACLPNKVTRDRLLGGIACLANPSFLWDSGVMKSLCQTFNGEEALPDHWEPLSAAQVTYTVKEINRLYSIYQDAKDLTPLYAEEPKIFLAGCCAYSGFSKLPEGLGHCSPQFERFFSEAEDPLDTAINDVQITKHEEVGLYCTVMGKIRETFLEKLK